MIIETWQEILPELEALLPVAYDHFLEPQSLPYALYLDAGSNNFVADDEVYYKDSYFDLELYTRDKDPLLESQIESIFNVQGIIWTRLATVYIQSEKMYQTTYQLS